MSTDEAVTGLARVLAHETCIRLVDALTGGPATVSDLASRLDLDQPRVSTHLALMRDVGLVDCQPSGRQRVYALRGEAPAGAVATLRALAVSAAGGGQPAGRAVRSLAGDSPIRLARTCYDHLAGLAGVQLLDGLLARGWVAPGGGRDVLVTETGAGALGRLGVGAPAAGRSRRALAIRCLDWTERRPHLGGALGAAVLTALIDQGRLRRRPGERAVELEPGEPTRFLEGVPLVPSPLEGEGQGGGDRLPSPLEGEVRVGGPSPDAAAPRRLPDCTPRCRCLT